MASVYNRQFGPFRGVDFTSNEKDVEEHRMAYAVNLYRNYDAEGGASVETIPGFRRLRALEQPINGIHRYKRGGTNYVIVHAGKILYEFEHEERDSEGCTRIVNVIADSKSTSFQFNNKFYLLDGKHLWSYDGAKLTQAKEDAYVPLGYINGEIYEQRNMLTNKMQERYILPATIEAVRDLYKDYRGRIVLPFHEPLDTNFHNNVIVKADGNEIYPYTYSYQIPIVDVDNKAESLSEDGKIKFVLLSNDKKHYSYGLEATRPPKDKETFYARFCNVVIPYTTEEKKVVIKIPALSNNAFSVTDGEFSGLAFVIKKTVGLGETKDYYDSSECEDMSAGDVVELVGDASAETYFNIYAKYTANPNVPHRGTDFIFYPPRALGWKFTEDSSGISLVTNGDEDVAIPGADIVISYDSDPVKFATAKKYTGFKDANPNYGGTSVEAIAECTLCAVFDGRVFLSGNPNLPNTVFYCQRDNTGHVNATYFGVYNYWNEGIEESPVVSLLSTANMLMVFKGDTVQDGSVFYRQGVSLDDDVTPRIYAGSAGVAGIGCVGATCNFFDDPVFLSRRGMEAIGKQTVNLERAMEHRSSNVDAKLMQEDLAGAFMTEWKGYLLIICPNGHVYMADSRATFTHGTGVVQYEWFYLEGIGEYKDAAKAYRYASYLPTGLEEKGFRVREGYEGELLDAPPTITEGIYHDGSCYLAEWEGEYIPRRLDGEKYADTSFHGARCAMTLDDVLYFGTENGGLFCFNNDYMGAQPYISIDKSVDYPYAAHKENESGWKPLGIKPEIYNLSRYFYSFAGQPIHSGMITAMSNAGAPMNTKTTEYRTAVCMMRSIPGSRCRVYWRKDMEAFRDAATVDMSSFDFDDMDLSSLVFSLKPSDSISLRVQERRWLYKQYQAYSDEFLRPFGVHSIAYSFHIHGKVRNT